LAHLAAVLGLLLERELAVALLERDAELGVWRLGLLLRRQAPGVRFVGSPPAKSRREAPLLERLADGRVVVDGARLCDLSGRYVAHVCL
jgi:hypothetical protein